jgi:DNA-binding MarR family transcriptional regulator
MDEDDQSEEEEEYHIADIPDIFESPTLTPDEVKYQLELENAEPLIEEIRSFFKQKGAIELICIARQHQFQDLEEKLDVTSPTLTKRINEAKELNLLTDYRTEKDGETVDLYTIDKAARPFVSYWQSVGILHTIERYLEVKNTLDNKKSNFRNFISDDGRLLNLALNEEDETVREIKQRYNEDNDSN